MTAVGRVDEFDRRYYQDEVTGQQLHSVTTVISATSSRPWLANWTAKLAAEFAVDHHDLVGQVLAETGRDSAVDLIKDAAKRRRDEAADLGTQAHAVIEALLLDLPIPAAADDAQQADADIIVDGFLNFMEDFEPEVELAEATVANPADGWAGTLDAVMRFPTLRRRLCVDVKTGANLDATIRIQLGTYPRASEVWLPQGQKAALPVIDGAAILHLRPEHTRGYKLLEVPTDGAYDVFLQMLAVYNAREDKLHPRPLYKPLPDGSQPPPLLEDIDGWGKCRGVLLKHGIARLDDVAAYTREQLLALKGFGPASLAQCAEMLAVHGLALTEVVARATA